MGAGKSTLVARLTAHLNALGSTAMPVWEGPTTDEPSQPLRLSPTLPHPFAPWEDLTTEEFIRESLRRWQGFVDGPVQPDVVRVCDGLLFHGNMTDLMLMEAPRCTLQKYVLDVIATLLTLNPVVIYLRQPDVAEAIDRVGKERGREWQDYQVDWKVSSPYGSTHGLQGFAGLVEFYVTYRAICAIIFQVLRVPTLQVENNGDWRAVYGEIARFLKIPFFDSGVS
jgi:hypothetical protein